MSNEKMLEKFEAAIGREYHPSYFDKDEYGRYTMGNTQILLKGFCRGHEAAIQNVLERLRSDDVPAVIAKAIWDWEHEGRSNGILDVEWSLLSTEYAEQAKVAIEALIALLTEDAHGK